MDKDNSEHHFQIFRYFLAKFFLTNSKIHLLPVRAHQADLVVQQNQVDQEDQVDLADHYHKNQIQDFPADQVDLVVRVDL